MTYREQIQEFLSKGREHIALAEKAIGLRKRTEERMHYRLACSYLIDTVTLYNEVLANMLNPKADSQEEDIVTPDAPDYN